MSLDFTLSSEMSVGISLITMFRVWSVGREIVVKGMDLSLSIFLTWQKLSGVEVWIRILSSADSLAVRLFAEIVGLRIISVEVLRQLAAAKLMGEIFSL